MVERMGVSPVVGGTLRGPIVRIGLLGGMLGVTAGLGCHRPGLIVVLAGADTPDSFRSASIWENVPLLERGSRHGE